MHYQEIQPSPALASYVKCFWILEGQGAGPDTTPKERILPDGSPEILVNFGDRFRWYGSDDSSLLQPVSFAYGQLRRHIEVGPTGNVGIIAVRFHPHGAAPFLAMPMNELADAFTDLSDLAGRDGTNLQERILNAPDNRQRVAHFEEFLSGRLKRGRADDALIGHSVRRIVASAGRLSVGALSDETGISLRHLERRFVSTVGMSPKLLARIVRFQKVLGHLRSDRPGSLTSLSYDCGYYDQAHFIRDFKTFSGISPRQYLVEETEFASFFTESESA